MQYDATLKELFYQAPCLMEMLVGSRLTQVVATEYPAVRTRKPDLVGWLADGRLLHLELQSTADDDMGRRMAEYFLALRGEHGRAPLQRVLYVGQRITEFSADIQEEAMVFRCPVIDIRVLDATPMLESAHLADNLLALLCHGGSEPAVVSEILKKIVELEGKPRADALQKLLVLSGLREARPLVAAEIQQMPIIVDERNIPFYDEFFEKGRKAGEISGGRGVVHSLLERRFGSLPEWVEQKLNAGSAEEIERWGLRLLDAARLEDVFAS